MSYMTEAIKNELRNRWTSAGRFYHDISHLNNCLEALNIMRAYSLPVDYDALEAAFWFHDAVYEPLSVVNEEDSAVLARQMLGDSITANQLDTVIRLILATKKHIATTLDEKVMLDIDLLVLGESPEFYNLYAANIRLEYALVPIKVYVKNRIAVLQGFLKRETIYHTRVFRIALEAQARLNIQNEINNLLMVHQ